MPVPADMRPVAETVIVPDDVIGPPLTEMPVPADNPTLVTVPVPYVVPSKDPSPFTN